MAKDSPDEEYEDHILDNELLDEFTEELETGINRVFERNPEADPRMELIVALGSFASHVAVNTGFGKKEFLVLMSDLFEDFEDDEEEPDKNSVN